MTQISLETRIVVLRWTVSLIVAFEAIRFVAASGGGHHLPTIGLPPWFWVALGATEAAAALLLLARETRKIGAYALFVIFAVAGLIHILHGDFDIGALIVYAAAVAVSMTQQQTTGTGERA